MYFSNTIKEHTETKILKALLFIITKKIKYLAVQNKDLYTENYIMFTKEIQEDLNKHRAMLSSWVGIFHVQNVSIFLKLIYIFNTISTKIPADFLESRFSEIYMESQRNWNS